MKPKYLVPILCLSLYSCQLDEKVLSNSINIPGAVKYDLNGDSEDDIAIE